MALYKGKWCAAANCNNSSSPELSFFSFPSDKNRQKIWVQNCRRSDLMHVDPERLRKNFRLCAEHFEETQFMNADRKRLIWNAIPTLFAVPNPPPTLTMKRRLPKDRTLIIVPQKKQKPASKSSRAMEAIASIDEQDNHLHDNECNASETPASDKGVQTNAGVFREISTMSSTLALKFVKDAIKMLTENRGYDYSCIEKIKVISAGTGGCVCEMLVEKQHTNQFGTMHGGCTATIVDTISSIASYAVPPHTFGVSVDLNVSFLNPVNLGDEILIEAKNMKIGKRLTFLEVVITRKSDGKLVATGKHTKFLNQSENSQL